MKGLRTGLTIKFKYKAWNCVGKVVDIETTKWGNLIKVECGYATINITDKDIVEIMSNYKTHKNGMQNDE